jgi:opacity protein-like surface antigen
MRVPFKTMLILMFCNSIHVSGSWAEELKHDWSGFYVGAYVSFTEVDATGVKPGATSWNIKTGRDAGEDPGIFIGYNYSLDDLVFGIEVSAQDHVADVPANTAASTFSGSIKHEELIETKLRLGYQLDRMLPYAFVSSGTMLQTWTAYSNTTPSDKGFTGYGVGMDYAINSNVFAGVQYGTLDWDYKTPSTTRVYNGDISYARLRLGYLF